MPKVFVPDSSDKTGATGTMVEIGGGPSGSAATSAQPGLPGAQQALPQSGSSVLIDGASVSVILLSIVGIFKMAMTSWLKVSVDRRQADLKYQADNRKSELEIEQATANALRSGFESQQKALLESNSQLTTSLIDQVTHALADIAKSQDKLNAQVEATAATLGQISSTQLEISQVLLEIKRDLAKSRPRPRS